MEIGTYHGCAGHPMQHRNTKPQAQKSRWLDRLLVLHS
ncbi:hypothetical protein 3S4_80 [uncultured Caudovirales phage]|uniref:Uncharacterized protein n=1 Tax=uncultured Caudovirales phage TaxID=2100421 RepID=A0A2H4J6R4_9CAUD|nr:hypothetical protein 3S4_80 [uncultured Caudovirales phage]